MSTYVKTISATGMKGRSFEHQLSPLTCITGPNFRGKTSRLAAIQLALLGYIPGEPPKKTNGAIMDFANGASLGVTATLDTGETYARRYWFEKGGVKSDPTAADPLDIPLLDASSFFKLGPTAKLAAMFARVELPKSYSVDGIVAGVRALKLAEPTADTEKALTDLALKVRAALVEQGINDGLQALVKDKGTIKAIVTYQKQRAAETIGHVRVATELRLRAGECSADTMAGIDAELKEARAALTTLEQQKAVLDERKQGVGKTDEKRAALQAFLDKPGRDFATDIATKKVDLQTLKTRAFPALVGKEHELEAVVTVAQTDRIRAGEASKKAAATVETLKAQMEILGKGLSDIGAMECCDRCGAKGRGWRDGLETSMKADLARVTKNLADAQAEYEKLCAAYPALVAAEKAAKDRCTAYVTLEDEIGEHTRKVNEATRELAALDEAREAAAALRKAKKEALASLVEVAPPTPEELAECAKAIVAAMDVVEGIDKRRTTALELAQEIRRATESAKENTMATVNLEAAKAVLAYLQETQETMIANGIGSIIDPANAMFGKILESPLAFHEGDIGRWEGSKFIKTATFTGAEEMLTYVAISAAMSSTAPLKLAIIDEFDRLDTDRQIGALDALRDAVETGMLDQVIIAAPRRPILPGKWSVIEL